MNRNIYKNKTTNSVSNPRTLPEELSNEQKREYKPSEWKDFFDEHKMIELENGDEFSVYTAGKRNEKPILIFLHGAGHTSMTFATIIKILKNDYYIMTYDFRGHGKTKCKEMNELSAENLVGDCLNVITTFFGKDIPKICLCGHSMGGSIAARVVNTQRLSENIVGLMLIDVVEGTAMEALPKMQIFLDQRPKKFTSVEQAIHWGLKSGMVQNIESAKISIPSQIKKIEENNYSWNVDLSLSEQYWIGWFSDLSNIFLSSKIPKLLILAGAERLDTPLTIAQMQGKYQLVVHPTCGHMIHEDAPDKVIQNIKHFYQRFW